jgi:hypothetical protein
MPVLISTDHTREISRSPGANVEAHKTGHKPIRVQSHPVGLVLLSDTTVREKAIMTRLILSALSGTIFAVAAIFTTVIDWTVLGWRNFWLAVCITAFIALIVFIWKVCERF